MSWWNPVPFLALLVVTARGGEKTWPQQLFRIEVFTLPRAVASDLLTRPLDGAALHGQVLEKAKAGNAQLDKLILLQVRHGWTGEVEQTDHFEYPTEHDPAQLAQTLALVNSTPDAVDKTPADPAKENVSPFNAGIGTISTTTATAFDMRPLGDTLKIDSSGASPGVVNYKLTSNELLAVDQFSDVPLPVFGAQSLEGKTKLDPGHPCFLGTYSRASNTGVKGQRKDDTLALAFLTSHEAPVPHGSVKNSAHTNDKEPFADRSLIAGSRRVTFEVLSLDKNIAHALLLETCDGQLVYDRAVKLGVRESTLTARVTSGNRMTMESVNEYISPTEFDPPQLAGRLILADSQLIDDLRSGRQTGLGNPARMDGGNPNGGFGFITTLSPTAFDMFPLGEQVQLEFSKGDDAIEVTLSATFTRLTDTTLYNSIRHPVVETRRLDTSVRMSENKRVLLGTLNKPRSTGLAASNKEDRVWLAFLRLTP